MRISFISIIAVIATLQCLSCAQTAVDSPHSSGGHDVTMTVTVDSFSAAADISTVEFSLTHREVFYGASTPMIFDSSAITYLGTIQNVPAGPIDFQVQVLDSGHRTLCSITETCTVSSGSTVTLSRQLSDYSCGITPP